MGVFGTVRQVKSCRFNGFLSVGFLFGLVATMSTWTFLRTVRVIQRARYKMLEGKVGGTVRGRLKSSHGSAGRLNGHLSFQLGSSLANSVPIFKLTEANLCLQKM